MADTSIARIKQLDQERAQLIASAKKEALDRAKTAIDELSGLGFNYQLTEGGKANTSKRPARKGTGFVKDAPCPVCKFKTIPLHDARKHRGQGGRKKPFTPAELTELQLEKA
jgi:hypothetical protein